MKFIYDFDHTLLNTDKFREDMSALFVKQGVSQEDFFMLYMPYFAAHRHFSIKPFVELLAAKSGKNASTIEKRFYSYVADIKKYLFPEAIPTLMYTKKLGQNYLLTLGDRDFQRRKVHGAGMERYFTSILYEQKSKTKTKLPISKSEEGVYFINDKLSESLELGTKYPKANVIWINRYNEKPHKRVRTIRLLKEIRDIAQ